MKWKSFSEGQPRDGQLVVIRYDGTAYVSNPFVTDLAHFRIVLFESVSDEQLFGDSRQTHWLPIPYGPRPIDGSREAMRQIDPDLYARCNVFEQQLRKRSPRITWTVSPYLRGTLDQGFKIRGTIDLDVEEVGAEVIASDQMLYSESLDALDYILYEITRLIAQELTRA